MKIKVNTIIRWILSIGLVIGVYTETGIFTTIVCFLILLKSELEQLRK